MIGQAVWFQRRKYGGWGLSPKTWQGWAYIGVVAGAVFLSQLLVSDDYKTTVMLVTAGIFSADLVHIMLTMPRDEMETKIEAIAERNALWGVIAVLAIGIAYQVASTKQVDPFLMAALVVGVVIKALSNLWLEKKGI